MRRFVEIRSYNLKPASRSGFHERMQNEAFPMLKRWKVDVVAFGSSQHDADSYYLIRSYNSLDDRQQSQDAFYGSAEWREGPRQGLLALIDSYTSIVLELEDSLVDALRQARVQHLRIVRRKASSPPLLAAERYM